LIVPAPIKLSSPATHEFWELSVLFEDDHLLAIDKPVKLLVTPDETDPLRPSLIELLHAGIAAGKPWAKDRNLSFLMNAYRLEFETSGVLLFAKSKPVHVSLASHFGSEQPSRQFIAIVRGTPGEDEFTVDAPLAPHPIRGNMMCVNNTDGKRSITRFKVLERFNGWALMQCWPLTSRTHQISVHLKSRGLTLVGDLLYSGKPLWLSTLKQDFNLKPNRTERPLVGRTALHAESLTMSHPVTAEKLTIHSPMPKDMAVSVKYLRRYAPPNGFVPGNDSFDAENGS
jgi:RluA family pseudouridine synthase